MALYLLCAITYSVVTPAWEAPDEVGHFDFIRHLRQTKTLPDIRTAVPGEAHQPPLYYIVATLFTLPANTETPVGAFVPNPDFVWHNEGGTDVNAGLRSTAHTFPYQEQALALQLARLTSVTMGGLTVFFIIKTGWLVFPNQPQIGLLAGALAAFTPQFLFISGAVNNNNLLILATTGACWQLVKALKQPQQWQQWLAVGLWLAAAVLSKLTGAAVGITAVFTLLLCAITARSWGLLLGGGAGLALPPLLLSGWWFVRNQRLYGDLLGLRIYEQIFAVNVRQAALQWSDLPEFAQVQFRSFWGMFGWMNVTAPDWFYTAVKLLLLAALLGGLLFIMRRHHVDLSRFQKQALAVLGAVSLAQEGIILYTLTRCKITCYQGRFLLPALVAIMLLVSIGLLQLVPPHWHFHILKVALLTLVGIALFMALGVIRPAYALIPLSP
jgi:4-amino-4-deoxy-L-arabinose transferase-like glycosyltransferase